LHLLEYFRTPLCPITEDLQSLSLPLEGFRPPSSRTYCYPSSTVHVSSTRHFFVQILLLSRDNISFPYFCLTTIFTLLPVPSSPGVFVYLPHFSHKMIRTGSLYFSALLHMLVFILLWIPFSSLCLIFEYRPLSLRFVHRLPLFLRRRFSRPPLTVSI